MNVEKKFNYVASMWIILSLLSASIEPVIVKVVYQGNITPYQLLFIKTLMAALVIYPLTRTFRWIGWKGMLKIGSVSILLLLNNLSSLMALKHISAVIYITFVTTNPAIIAIINSALGRDRLDIKFWTGFLLCFFGVLLTLDPGGINQWNITGIFFVFCAMICTVIYRTRMEDITSEFKPALVSTYIFWINGLLVLLFFTPEALPMPAEAWKPGIWIGLAGAMANVAFLYALHILGSTRVSIFNMLQRPLIIIFAAIILKEHLSLAQIGGIIMVMAGIHLTKVQRVKKSVPEKGRIVTRNA
ncbi:MAG: DMT family transporter [Candidatus Eremiobacterota bacterium]